MHQISIDLAAPGPSREAAYGVRLPTGYKGKRNEGKEVRGNLDIRKLRISTLVTEPSYTFWLLSTRD